VSEVVVVSAGVVGGSVGVGVVGGVVGVAVGGLVVGGRVVWVGVGLVVVGVGVGLSSEQALRSARAAMAAVALAVRVMRRCMWVLSLGCHGR
jgi:hypothetical protein